MQKQAYSARGSCAEHDARLHEDLQTVQGIGAHCWLSPTKGAQVMLQSCLTSGAVCVHAHHKLSMQTTSASQSQTKSETLIGRAFVHGPMQHPLADAIDS